MKQGTKTEEKDKVAISRVICQKYKTNLYSLEDCCKEQGINQSTFWTWRKDNQEIQSLFKEAQEILNENYKSELKEKAKSSLMKKVEGYEYEEIVQEYKEKNTGRTEEEEKQVGDKMVRKVKKHIPPSDTAIIFALTNADPENFKHKRNIEADIQVQSNFEKMSDEELWTFILEKIPAAQLQQILEQKSLPE